MGGEMKGKIVSARHDVILLVLLLAVRIWRANNGREEMCSHVKDVTAKEKEGDVMSTAIPWPLTLHASSPHIFRFISKKRTSDAWKLFAAREAVMYEQYSSLPAVPVSLFYWWTAGKDCSYIRALPIMSCDVLFINNRKDYGNEDVTCHDFPRATYSL